MKTEAEIREAIKLMEGALAGAQVLAAPVHVRATYTMVLEALYWVILDPRGERFQKEMVEPCRKVDRAGRQ